MEKQPIIYLTGFGPFGNHHENASQKVIEEIIASSLDKELGVQLVTDIFDVDYHCVMQKVPEKWLSNQPQLVIHVGVSSLANKEISLERKAFNNSYSTLDIIDHTPENYVCLKDCAIESVESGLDLEKIVSECCYSQSQCAEKLPLKFVVSEDPGRYLCGYIYFLSLNVCRHRSLFVHIPTLQNVANDQSSALSLLTRAVAQVVKAAYAQTGQCECHIEENAHFLKTNAAPIQRVK